MALTVTEKNELRSIIERRINERIEEIRGENRAKVREIEDEVYEQTLDSLGIRDIVQEFLTASEEEERARQRVAAARRALDKAGIQYYGHLGTPKDIIRQDVLRKGGRTLKQRLAESEFGRTIQKLEEEKQRLDELVWISTSTKQIHEIFNALNELLGQKPTQLESDAANFTPMEE